MIGKIISDSMVLAWGRVGALLGGRAGFFKRIMYFVFICFFAGIGASGFGVGNYGLDMDQLARQVAKDGGGSNEATLAQWLGGAFSGVIIWVGFFVSLLFGWIGSRFVFVLYYNVRSVSGSGPWISAPFSEYSRQANSYFFVWAALGFIGAVFSTLTIFIGNQAVATLSAFIFGVLLSFLFFCFSGFVAPIMAYYRINVWDAADRFLEIFCKNILDFLICFLASFGLLIASSMVCGVFGLLVILVVGLGGLILIGIPAIFFHGSGLFLIYAIGVGLPLVLLAVGLVLMTIAPVGIFFRVWYMSFLQGVVPELEFFPKKLVDF